VSSGETNYQVSLSGILFHQFFSVRRFKIGEFKTRGDGCPHQGKLAALVKKAALPGALRHYYLDTVAIENILP
jgi:hypothetical protein